MTTAVTRLTLVRHAPTAATWRAALPADEPPEPSALVPARALAARLGRCDEAWSGPAASARETAAAMGLGAFSIDGALDDAHPGAWRGRSLAELERAEPVALQAWLTDPAFRPPGGGESVEDVLARVRAWLDERAVSGVRIVAVTSAIVIRAAVADAMLAPPQAVWRIDVSPLSRTILHARAGHWTVRGVNL